MQISVQTNIKDIERALNNFARKQVPFAAAAAMTATAKLVQQAEVKNLSHVLDNPTPFTLRSIGITAARKNNLVAKVYMRDVAASYLEPYEFGGVHKLNGRALLNPKDVGTNQYGNLPRNVLARLKGRRDVFIGAVKTKDGKVINGVWQRPLATAPLPGRKAPKGANASTQLKLLIRFGDALEVKQHLGYRTLAKMVIAASFNREMERALTAAMATARK
jgi:hypothetical protein